MSNQKSDINIIPNSGIRNQEQNTGSSLITHHSSLLLEIGTEEIPSRFLPAAISDMKNIAAKIFDEYRIEYNDIKVFATPRRIALIMNGVASAQKDMTKEIFGPSKKVAYDENGNSTKAATGFANSLGIKVSDLRTKLKGKGEYIVAVIEEKGVETREVLPEVFKKIILSLHFPKSMRWGDGNLLFVRPIRWILAMAGQETVTIEIDGIKSSNMTRGHRFLSPASFQIKEISSYINLLENNSVIIDQEKRKSIIRKGITSLFENSDMQPVFDEGLLDTVSFIVEFPVPVLCSFAEDYLKLPAELLITVMKDHQKYFAVRDSNGNLASNFIVISNTKPENSETVRTGAERVIKARFDDAKFYFSEDKELPLIDRVDSLKSVTFHDELGSLLGKTERIISVAAFLSERLLLSIKDKAVRAARLSKTDLITGVVREFPELQGTMGKYYALHNGEDAEVAAAIQEQYLPQNFGGMLPQTDTGAILSLSDKIDNVASFFSIGLIPTGSEDPFALRRQAMGIASIILDRGYQITVREIFDSALKNLPNIKSPADTLRNIIVFMEQRIEFILSSMGYSQDLIKSVLSLSSTHPLRTINIRIEAVKLFRDEKVFPDFLLAIKRVNNITPKTPMPPVRDDLLIQEEEKNLYASLLRLKEECAAFLEKENFHEGLKIFSEITVPINNFFDKVLVMDKNEEVKTNRLSLLKEIWTTASMFADFSKLV